MLELDLLNCVCTVLLSRFSLSPCHKHDLLFSLQCFYYSHSLTIELILLKSSIMMTLANYGIKSSKYKDPISAKSLNKSLQIRNRAESSLKHCLKTFHRVPKDKRNDIIGALEEYYSRVPFNVLVWNTNQTKQCVENSILSLDYDFNPYRAREAFRTIEEMLINLEYLPWHKEFTKIFTYSGGFKHTISDPLADAESVLKAAGFEQESDDRPMHLVIHPKGAQQVERFELIAHVIFDCMLAQVIMSDIIDVFENCCKASKTAPSQVPNNEINCYTWIQHYFRERSHQISEKACSSIQELLNNITNHLTKHRMTSVKTSSRNERSLDGPNLDRVNEISYPKKETGDTQQRKLMIPKSIEDSNLFKLSDDLLKLPNYSEHANRSLVTKRDPACIIESRSTDHSSIPFHNGETHADLPRETITSQYANHAIRSLPKSREILDMIDSQVTTGRANNNSDNDNEFSAHAIRPDVFPTDRELLIPKQERKYVAPNQRESYRHNYQAQPISNRQPYRSQVDVSPGNLIDQYRNHSAVGTSKSNHEDPSRFRNSPSSQLLQAASKSSSSRYDSDTDHRRYEYRDADRPFSSRSYWSCNSCTFLNQTSNDICEICGNRKPL